MVLNSEHYPQGCAPIAGFGRRYLFVPMCARVLIELRCELHRGRRDVGQSSSAAADSTGRDAAADVVEQQSAVLDVAHSLRDGISRCQSVPAAGLCALRRCAVALHPQPDAAALSTSRTGRRPEKCWMRITRACCARPRSAQRSTPLQCRSPMSSIYISMAIYAIVPAMFFLPEALPGQVAGRAGRIVAICALAGAARQRSATSRRQPFPSASGCGRRRWR